MKEHWMPALDSPDNELADTAARSGPPGPSAPGPDRLPESALAPTIGIEEAAAAPAAASPLPPRVMDRTGRIVARREHLPTERKGDLYHLFMSVRWPRLIAVMAGTYLTLNLLFAALYLIGGDDITAMRPGSIIDAFFFSIQTMATIGYGVMAPKTLYANILVTLETIVSILVLALTTGLLFTRFSRPTARVMFSDVAVITLFEGLPTLMFRLANQRTNQILQAEIRVTLVRNEITREGHPMRRLHDLKLQRAQTSFFSLSWTVMHSIDEASPLYEATAETLARDEVQIVILLYGVDETFSQPIHGRHGYAAENIRWNHRFVDILRRSAEEGAVIDYALFHDTRPNEVAPGSPPNEVAPGSPPNEVAPGSPAQT